MSAVGTEALIIEALMQRLATLVLSPVLAVAYPDVVFPAAGQVKPATYLRVSFMRARTASVGISRWDERPGIMQVDVVYSTAAGPIGPTNYADAVAAWFPRNWSTTNGAVRVDVYETPSIDSPVPDVAPYSFIPVSIRYRVFTP